MRKPSSEEMFKKLYINSSSEMKWVFLFMFMAMEFSKNPQQQAMMQIALKGFADKAPAPPELVWEVAKDHIQILPLDESMLKDLGINKATTTSSSFNSKEAGYRLMKELGLV